MAGLGIPLPLLRVLARRASTWGAKATRTAKARTMITDYQREKRILELLDDGQTLQQIADALGISKQRVGQITKDLGINVAQRRREINQAKRDAVLESRRTKCIVCGKEFIRSSRGSACSEACREALLDAGYWLRPGRKEAHRLYMAKSILKHADARSASQVRWAQRVINGMKTQRQTGPSAGSKAAEVLEKLPGRQVS